MYTCEYCNKNLSSESSLNTHIKTNKKCKEKRGTNDSMFVCNLCKKQYTSKQSLNRHIENCVVRPIKDKENEYIRKNEELNKILESLNYKLKIVEEQNADLKEQNSKLERKIEELNKDILSLARQGMEKETVRQNIIQLLAPKENLTTQMIENFVDQNLTKNHLRQEEKGIAKFISEINKTDDGKKYVVCTDYSRKVFQTLDEEENVVKDPEAKSFLEKVKEPIVKAGFKIVGKEFNDNEEFDHKHKASKVLSAFRENPTVVSNEFAKTCVV